MSSENLRARLVHGCFVVLTLVLSACGTEGPALPSADAATGDSSAVSAPAEPCGLCYAHSHRGAGYDSSASTAQLGELAQAGIAAISVTSFGWMSSLADNVISNGGSETPTAMRAVVKDGIEQKMVVMFKPHLWIRGGGWRGEIAPSDWNAWFDSYQSFIVDQARLARDAGAQWFVVGVELKTAVAQSEQRWRQLIDAVRKVYSGKVTYAANWDNVERVPFWDALDAVGVQMFAPLSSAGTSSPPAQAALDSVAAGWLEKYGAVARGVSKPLILTEAGFINYEGSTAAPYVWPQQVQAKQTAAGDEEQLRGYRALLNTFGRSPDVVGIYWWKWFSDPQDTQEGAVGFWPRDKPVEQVLRDLCAARASARASR